ncbi:TetR/AcrR family transcriptional regulator [Pseudonocardia spinosispora]|uniref:TetR/AcrR family transcriptional regulator n=1 Tax=Pseudonocardia spinosispora TaxID=103441 RepID=UPI00055C2258|nr:TetR/AcrR family transcriptional regulator [Pseudonocardia spinosispora]
MPETPGRPRDTTLDDRILAATRDLLAENGYQGLSIGAVARAAGTTRPSVYLRFTGKQDLATRAIAGMNVPDELRTTKDIRADLIAELAHFRTAVTRPNGMAFVGTVLAEERHTPELIEHFRDRLVRPRRRRVAGVLRRGMSDGTIREDLDVDATTTMLIGSVYASYIAGGEVPADWPERTVNSIWPALTAGDGR